MTLKNVALSIGIALSLSACATFSGAENQENLSQLKTGMTQNQVLTLLGTPDHVVRTETQDRWTYEFRTQEKAGRNVFVLFEDGTLVKAGELDGRELAASEEDRVSGTCLRWSRPDFVERSLCRK